jgi:hypothetical protein
MKSIVSGGLMLGVIAAAAIMISSSIMISYSYASTKEDVTLRLSNRLDVAANEVEDRGSDAAQKLRDKSDQLDKPPVSIKLELRDSADKVEDHTSKAAQKLRDKASQIVQPTG